MSAAASLYKLSDTHIDIGVLSIPFSFVTKFWVYRTKRIVQLICSTAQGEGFRCNIAIEYSTAEKAKELFAALFARTTRSFKCPQMDVIQPSRSSIVIEFGSPIGANVFHSYFAPLIFPDPDINMELEYQRFTITCQSEGNSTQRIESLLTTFSHCVADSQVEHKLHDNNDPLFPGTKRPERCELDSSFNFGNKKEKSFEIASSGVTEITWTQRLQKCVLPAKLQHIHNWINKL
jgi:hypothetical protein